MKHGSLFSGIGGFDLAAHWAGWENVFQVEIDPWCRRILAKHFPNAQRFTDIREFDGNPWRGAIDIISGGFPCQPFSSAGKRLGKEDERHLWPEMLRVIREAKPKWVVGENVRGLVNWSEGMVFDEVQSDLEAAGYEIISFILPAAGVNAPHERYRVWPVAYASGADDRGNTGELSTEECRSKWNNLSESRSTSEIFTTNTTGKQMGHSGQSREYERMEDAPNPYSIGHENRTQKRNGSNKKEKITRENNSFERPRNTWIITTWDEWTAEPPVCRVDDGVPNRMDRIRGLGNAIVPEEALQIFETINEYERLYCQ